MGFWSDLFGTAPKRKGRPVHAKATQKHRGGGRPTKAVGRAEPVPGSWRKDPKKTVGARAQLRDRPIAMGTSHHSDAAGRNAYQRRADPHDQLSWEARGKAGRPAKRH